MNKSRLIATVVLIGLLVLVLGYVLSRSGEDPDFPPPDYESKPWESDSE